MDRHGNPVWLTMLAAAACLTGCATYHVHPDGPATGSPAVAACPAGTGTTAENPLDSASRFLSLMTKEQVVCPGGAIATADTAGPAGLVTVRCPRLEIPVFVADGALADCIPAPLTTIDPAAAAMNSKAMAALADGRLKQGLRLARKAVELQEDAEALQMTLGAAWMANGNFVEAERTLARARKINPKSARVRLAHAVALSELGHKDAYAGEIAALFHDVPETDSLHWELMCRLADNFNRVGNRVEAIRLARVACDSGVSMCCGLAASDPEAVEVGPGAVPPADDGGDQGAM